MSWERAFRKAKDGFKKEMGAGEYVIAKKQIECPHCGGTAFEEGASQLNTAAATIFNLDWLNKSATVLSCTRCGYIMWFSKDPVRVRSVE